MASYRSFPIIFILTTAYPARRPLPPTRRQIALPYRRHHHDLNEFEPQPSLSFVTPATSSPTIARRRTPHQRYKALTALYLSLLSEKLVETLSSAMSSRPPSLSLLRPRLSPKLPRHHVPVGPCLSHAKAWPVDPS